MSDVALIPVLIVGALATQMWRWLGVALGGRIAPGSRVFEWAGCVAYALLAAVIIRLIVMPSGGLADVPLAVRVGASVAATVVYLVLSRNLVAGVATGAAVVAVMSSL